MIKKNYLNNINNSNKPFIIYKTIKGFDLFTDFSKKITLNNENIINFLNRKHKFKTKHKDTDLMIGFFGYELLNNLIGVKLFKQKNINFPKGIFYKPETKIYLKEDLNYQLNSSQKIDKKFKINIDQKSYTKIFNKFKKKIRAGETYQIKICTKYKNKSLIDPLDFFCRLTKSNLAPAKKKKVVKSKKEIKQAKEDDVAPMDKPTAAESARSLFLSGEGEALKEKEEKEK